MNFKAMIVASFVVLGTTACAQTAGQTAPTPGADGNKYVPYEQRTGNESVVYFTRSLSPEGLIAAYEKVSANIKGRVGVKLHTGEKNGPNIIPAEWVKALVEKAVEIYGRLDGFVSNAGIGMGGNPLHEYDMEAYERIFALNSEGVFAGMKYAAEAIFRSKSKGGFLINVASVAGLVPQRGQALYTATKFGVVGMTRAAALDYAAYGITVNAICPGYTKTSIFGDIPEAAMTMFAKDCPAGRMGDPMECAWMALFLASDMARYITGAAIPVDGALSAGHQNVTTWKNPELYCE